MQQFTGTKTVKACMMSRKSAEEIIGRKMRADSDEIEDEHGYLVQYPDGYRSWSPLKTFEEAYRLSETHIDRMMIEKEEVEKRYLAGRKFSFSADYSQLSDTQKNLLRKQLDQMEAYLYTLTRRIELEVDMAANRAANCRACKKDIMDPVDADGKPAEPLRKQHE